MQTGGQYEGSTSELQLQRFLVGGSLASPQQQQQQQHYHHFQKQQIQRSQHPPPHQLQTHLQLQQRLQHTQHPPQQLLQQRQHPQPHLQSLPQAPSLHQHQHQQQQHKQVIPSLELRSDSPEVPSPIVSPTGQNRYQQQKHLIGEFAANEENLEESEKGGNRWPRQETLALIDIRTEMDPCFRECSLKGPLWEEISRKLGELGYQRTAKKCKEKFENIHKYYRKTKDAGKAGRQDRKSYQFSEQLHALYRASAGNGEPNGSAGAGIATSTKSEDGCKGQALLSDRNEDVAGSDQKLVIESNCINTSSDCSQDEYNGDPIAASVDLRAAKKRKWRSMRSKMAFFENLMQKLLDKQERMNREFLETVTRRDEERRAREEAWRRQEVDRMDREKELRAHEQSLASSRDATLVDFLQKATGQTLHLPQPQPALSPVIKPSELSISNDTPEEKQVLIHDPHSKRWPKTEVQALIRLRSSMEDKFQESGPKGRLWEDISTEMVCMGYNRNAKRCKEKWENINKYFRKTKEISRKHIENGKSCPYFQQLDTLYSSGVLHGSSSKTTRREEQKVGEILDQCPPGDSKRGNGHAEDDQVEKAVVPPCGGTRDLPGSKGRHFASTHFTASRSDDQINDLQAASKRPDNYQHQILLDPTSNGSYDYFSKSN